MVKKKPATPPHEEHADETWLVPYSDLLTLLMALFIVLFASSSLDKNKAAQIQYALAAAFGGGAGMGDSAGGMGGSFSNDAQDLNLQEDGVIISSDANGATLEMTSINLFDKGSVILRPEAIPVIKKISLLLNSSKYKKYRIVVEGHTDDTNESDTLPSNWELSAARAGAVVRAMINNDMEVSRFKAVGLAEISPAYPNLNPYGEPIPENRLKNRRVIVRIEF